MVAFINFKKLAFPSSVPDNNDAGTVNDMRVSSALDSNENLLHYKTINNSNMNPDSETEEKKGTLKGRRSEEPPDIYQLSKNLINKSKVNRKDNVSPESVLSNTSPKFVSKVAKIIPKSNPSEKAKESEKPVQNIMKVGNLFMFNVYKNGEDSTSQSHTIKKSSARATPVSKIEMDQFDVPI